MKKLLQFILIISFCAISSNIYAQKNVAGIEFTKSIQVDNNKLDLNGAGTRVKLWMDMYAMGLYVNKTTTDSKAIISVDSPMSIRLQIISGLISAEKMETATLDGFKNSTKGNTSALKSEINTFIAVFKDEITKGDNFIFTYIPNKGTIVSKNKKQKAIIKGLEFKKALFGIWLGQQPADKDLKKQLLKN